MSILHLSCEPPKELKDRIEKELEDSEMYLSDKNIKLSDEQASEIERKLNKKIEAFKKQTSQQKKRLTRYYKIMEGIVEETNFPFEGASNITLHYAAGIARTFKATFDKTMYQDENLFIPVVDPSANIPAKAVNDLSEVFNYTFSKQYNGMDALKEGTVPCCRDGIFILSGSWEKRIETASEYKTYANAKDFYSDYPDADSAGLSEEEFQGVASRFIADPDNKICVSFNYDYVDFNGIEYHLTPFADFVYWPTYQKSLHQMEIYGTLYDESKEEIKRRAKRGEFYNRGADKCDTFKNSNEVDPWKKSRLWAEGVSAGEAKDAPLELGDFVLRLDRNGDGIPEKYFVTFCPKAKAILSMRPYRMRNNIDMAVPFRYIGRENRFPGVSLVGDTEDLFNQIDVEVRHQNNVAILTTSPILIANKGIKDDIDLGSGANLIRPGVTFWVADTSDKSIRQLPLQDLKPPQTLMEKMGLYSRYIELVWGPTQGMSGSQTVDDPRSPARKTQMLLMQANSRIDNYMDEFRMSMPEVAKLHAALLIQYYGKSQMSIVKDGQPVTADLSLLSNPALKWEAKRRSVQLTPEFAMARMEALIQIYMTMKPLVMQGDPLAIEMWNRQVINSGEPDASKFLVDGANAQAIAQQAKMMQDQMAQRSIQLKAELGGQTSMHREIGKAAGKKIGADMTGQGLAQLEGAAAGPANGQPPSPQMGPAR